MNASPAKRGDFEKVGECLYRYSSTGTYYAVLRHAGKLIRRSLQTDDRALAKRRLADFRQTLERIDPRAGRISVAEMADRYMETIGHLADKTRRSKVTITKRIKSDWPGGSSVLVRDVRESHVRAWLSAQARRASTPTSSMSAPFSVSRSRIASSRTRPLRPSSRSNATSRSAALRRGRNSTKSWRAFGRRS